MNNRVAFLNVKCMFLLHGQLFRGVTGMFLCHGLLFPKLPRVSKIGTEKYWFEQIAPSALAGLGFIIEPGREKKASHAAKN